MKEKKKKEKKKHFLNINPSNIIVLKFHMLLRYICHQFQNNVSYWVNICIKVMYIFKL